MESWYPRALRPEFSSEQIHDGPGNASLWAAAKAWNILSYELEGMATRLLAVFTNLAPKGWNGPAAESMSVAVADYQRVLSATAVECRRTSAHVTNMAKAFEAVKEATVPPPAVKANRDEHKKLVASNLTGRNTPAIAANEAEYERMLSQNIDAILVYSKETWSQVGHLGPWPQLEQLEPWPQLKLWREPPFGAQTGGFAAGVAQTGNNGLSNIGIGNAGSYNWGIGNAGINNIGFLNSGNNNWGIGLTGDNQWGIGWTNIGNVNLELFNNWVMGLTGGSQWGIAWPSMSTLNLDLLNNWGIGNWGIGNAGNNNIGLLNMGDNHIGFFNS